MTNIISLANHKNYSHYCWLWYGRAMQGQRLGNMWWVSAMLQWISVWSKQPKRVGHQAPARDFPKNPPRPCKKSGTNLGLGNRFGLRTGFLAAMHQFYYNLCYNLCYKFHYTQSTNSTTHTLQILLHTYYKFFHGFSCHILFLWF